MKLLFRNGNLREEILDKRKLDIDKDIENLIHNQILNNTIDEILKAFYPKYEINKISLKENERYQEMPREIRVQKRDPNLGFYKSVDAIQYEIIIPIEGDGKLLNYLPSHFIDFNIEGYVENNRLHLFFSIVHNENLNQKYEITIKYVRDYIQSINSDINVYKGALERHIKDSISKRKENLENGYKKARSLQIPIKSRDASPEVFEIPLKPKKIDIKLSDKPLEVNKPIPTINNEIYENILEICLNMSIVMERNPKTFREFHEGFIRDVFLLVLNAFFEGKATGETFNKKGKTDILIRYNNDNLFISECKFWKGPSLLKDTINQLLSYTTWRDTKTAIFFFNKDTKISTIQNKIESEVPKHECYLKSYKHQSLKLKTEKGIYGYNFCLPNDRNSEIYLSILIFDIPNLS